MDRWLSCTTQSATVCGFTLGFSVHDYSVRRLIRAKMANIFRPGFWKAIMTGASGSSVGIYGGEEVVLKGITDSKAVDHALKGALILPIKKEAKGKGEVKAKAQTPADLAKTAGSKGGSKAAKGKKAKAAKAKAKKAKAKHWNNSTVEFLEAESDP